jgi:hypothetical protein
LHDFDWLVSNFDSTGGAGGGGGGTSLRAGRAYLPWIFDDIVRLYGILTLFVHFWSKNTVTISPSF